MISPASRHKAKAEAGVNASASAEVLEPLSSQDHRRNRQAVTNNNSLMSVRLHDDVRRVGKVRSRQARNVLKSELIPHYLDHLTGAMMHARLAKQAGDNYSLGKSNLVLTTICIWCFDVGEYQRGLPLFEFIVEMSTRSPDNFKSSMVEIITRTLAENIIKHNDGLSSEFLGVVHAVLELTEGVDMADEVRASLYRAYALVNQVHEPEKALKYYKNALAMNSGLGVKRVIKRLEKTIGEL